MRNYETGISNKALAAIIVAVVVTSGVFLAVANLPNGGIGPNTTPTIPTGPTDGVGARAALYLQSMRDNVEYYWMSNSSFVNNDLSTYYDAQHSGAFVDGLYMVKTETGGEINLFFAPYPHTIGTGTLSETEWNTMSGSLIDDGLGMMDAVEDPPTSDWPHTWPVDFYTFVCFDDNTFFYFGYTSSDGLAFIQNGTYSGSAMDESGPIIETWNDGIWLDAGDHLTIPLQTLYSTITGAVSYPE
jgi:hypothetical protein